jgi:hypothetical protein
MTAGKALGVLAVLAAAGSWFASGALTRRPAPFPADPPWPASQTEVGRTTARLALGLKLLTSPSRTAPYTAPARNPFHFGASRPGSVQPATSAATATGTPAAAGMPPERPAMQLAGMAEDPGQQGPVRRAVIVAAGELFVVGTGDLVLGRFRVTRTDAEAVELEDLQGGPRTILALR